MLVDCNPYSCLNNYDTSRERNPASLVNSHDDSPALSGFSKAILVSVVSGIKTVTSVKGGDKKVLSLSLFSPRCCVQCWRKIMNQEHDWKITWAIQLVFVIWLSIITGEPDIYFKSPKTQKFITLYFYRCTQVFQLSILTARCFTWVEIRL